MTTLVDALNAKLVESDVAAPGTGGRPGDEGGGLATSGSVSSEWPDVEARLMEILDRLFDPQSAA